MKLGLVLEGGANRGVFTAGVLDHWMEKGVQFDYIVGTSAGACNAMNYISGQIGRGRDSMIHADRKLDYFGLQSLLKTGHLFDLEKAFWDFPNGAFPFDYAAYFANPIEREFVATNCLTGEPVYLHDKPNQRRYLMKIGMASSAMPGATPIIRLEHIPYADGGVADSIPVRRAFAKGCDRVVIVRTRRMEFRMQPSKSTKLIARLNRRYPAFVRALEERPKNYNQTLSYILDRELEGTVLTVYPEMEEVSRMERDYQTLMRFYAHGYEQAKAIYPELKKFMSGR